MTSQVVYEQILPVLMAIEAYLGGPLNMVKQ